MIDTPKVSVIIPTYNRAAYIREAIDSVMAQTYRDFEIIVVDDGSIDNTMDIVHSYGGKVAYYYRKNRGPGAARNYGVSKAKGEYIAFLDSDDIWLPQKLELQVKELDENPGYSLICSQSHVIDKNGRIFSLWGKDPSSPASFETLLEGNFVTTLTVMMRRGAFISIGGFDERLSNAQDYDLWLRLSKEGHAFKYIDIPLGKCRTHDTNNTKNTDKRVMSYQLLLSKREIWDSMPYLKRRKRLSGIYYHFAQAYLASHRYAKAALFYSRSVFYHPFAGFYWHAGLPARSSFYKIMRVYYLILKCGLLSLLTLKR